MGHKQIDKKKKKTSVHLHKGVLEVTRSGMGFVIAEGLHRDILVRPNDFNTAMHGDTVLVKLLKSKGSREQGMVESVVERKQTDFPGHIEMGDGLCFFYCRNGASHDGCVYSIDPAGRSSEQRPRDRSHYRLGKK